MECRSTAALRFNAGAPGEPQVAIRPKSCCTRVCAAASSSSDRTPTERRNSRFKSSFGASASHFRCTWPKPLEFLKPVRPPSVGLAYTSILKGICRISKPGDVNTRSLLVSFRALALQWISKEPVSWLRPDRMPHDACGRTGFVSTSTGLVGRPGTSEP